MQAWVLWVGRPRAVSNKQVVGGPDVLARDGLSSSSHASSRAITGLTNNIPCCSCCRCPRPRKEHSSSAIVGIAPAAQTRPSPPLAQRSRAARHRGCLSARRQAEEAPRGPGWPRSPQLTPGCLVFLVLQPPAWTDIAVFLCACGGPNLASRRQETWMNKESKHASCCVWPLVGRSPRLRLCALDNGPWSWQ